MSDTSRECPKCLTAKPLDQFPLGARLDGRHTYCRPCMNAYKRAYYQRNREKEVARSMAYNAKNYEKFLARQRVYNEKNKDRYKEYIKARPEQAHANSARNNARRRSAKINGLGVTAADWREIKKKYQQRCCYCGKKEKLTMDHATPLSRGGSHEPSNIVPACGFCNSSKHALDSIQFAQRRGMLL